MNYWDNDPYKSNRQLDDFFDDFDRQSDGLFKTLKRFWIASAILSFVVTIVIIWAIVALVLHFT